jgi:5-methylcytosine-specific restriction enzyme A
MKASTVEFAADIIGTRIGVAVEGRFSDRDKNCCELIPLDVHPNEGFIVQFCLGWRSAEASLIPGPFSGPLINRMGKSGVDGKQTFGAFASGVKLRKVKILMRVNGSEVSPETSDNWPLEWSKLELALKAGPLVVEVDNDAQHERLIIDLAVPLFGMAVALIGAEENELPTLGEAEGRSTKAIHARYERKHLNREACIQLKGTKCTVCDFDFGEAYGTLGLGFVEVHHLKPVATLGADYQINVRTDLAPLCSNCHKMAHREDPPVRLERLREIVEERRRAKGLPLEP